ncbi:MAG: hypothetical protein GY694_06590 [Gammaproteobacteria bacterium]|nr:hypothetical protein [Gammaproteobacteria bacterium]
MNDGLISNHWYRVAKLAPKLHSHVEIHRHDYRGLIWYMLEDTTTGRNHRFNPAAYQFIGLLNGQRSVQDIYDQICEQLKDYAPGQESIIQILGQLHSADLLQSNVLINTEELFDRQTQNKQSKLKQRFMNPVAQKIPLWDPEEFLNKHFNKVRWIFNYRIALIWLILLIYTIIQASQNWPQISQFFTINALSPYNLILLFFLYPPIKIVHELGHAFSAKLEGGEVHEMGVNFLLFMPIPYVNVSTATRFRSKYKRMLVSSIGILVESFLAALGLLLFLATEPGLVNSIGFNIFIIGGISSLFFNGNPLLKFDGYYILADALSIPNLYQRSGQYWHYFFQHYLFGLKEVSSPASAPGETFWFISYSISSLLYRLGVLWFIFVIITEKFFLLGVLLTSWILILQIGLPLFKMLSFIFSSSSLTHKRSRAILLSTLLIGLFIVLSGFTPIPSYTLTEGVVWLPDEALLKAQQNGFAGSLKIKNNQTVKAGTPVIELHDPFLKTEEKIAKARLNELKSQYRAKRVSSVVEVGIIKEEICVAQSELTHTLEKIKSMSITAFKSGTVFLPDAEDLPGRFIQQGELLGYIMGQQATTIRMAVSQSHIGQLRQAIKDIKIRFANDISSEYSAQIIRQAPEGINQLPSAALSTRGGGQFIVSPDSKNELLTLQKIFIIDLQFDPQQQNIPVGTRAYVRIHHGGEPLARQLFRRIRQIFLRQFNV